MPTEPLIIPKNPEPVNWGPVATPVAAVPVPVKKKIPLWIPIGILILIIIFFALAMRKSTDQTPAVTPSPTPTPTIVPVVTRPLSPVATTSAFIDFEAKLDTVTRGIQNAPIDNQSLLPPRIDLPLGF